MKKNNLYIEPIHKDFHDAAHHIKSSIIKSLLYFDIFNYPLTLQEIVLFSSNKLSNLQQIETALADLEAALIIYKFDTFYSLKNDITHIEKRRKGNEQAYAIMPKAYKRAHFIYKFPFVRSVNISGSLSKNYFDETTDIDFFIITSPGRIWLCRALLTLYKKIFLLNSRKYFCINYFIDTEDLFIPDKNLFSATEIITLKNQAGEKYYTEFLKTNSWVSDYFPNFNAGYSYLSKEKKQSALKRFFEKMLAGKFGDYMDTFFFKLTYRFWKKKFTHLSETEFNVNMRSKKHVSKHHPQGFQFKVLKAYHEKCKNFELTTSIPLS